MGALQALEPDRLLGFKEIELERLGGFGLLRRLERSMGSS